MKFVFLDNSEYEADIITKVLSQENILFKTKERKLPVYFDDEDDEPCDYMSLYDITCFTDLAHYDFVKKITNKKIDNIKILNKIYYTKKAAKRGKKSVCTRKKTSN